MEADANEVYSGLFELSLGEWYSRAFQVSVKLAVNDKLESAGEGKTCQQLSQLIGLCQDPGFRGAADFLDLLTSLKLLQREGTGSSALYSNSPAASKYLVKGRPLYIGTAVAIQADRLSKMWAYLETALREGAVPEEVHATKGTIDVYDPKNVHVAVGMGNAMTSLNKGSFLHLATKFDFSPYNTLADLGGSLGILSVAVCEAQPHMSCTSYDLPFMESTARQHVQSQGLGERCQVATFDFFSGQSFPQADIITMALILHNWGKEKKKLLLRESCKALPPGGAFVAVDYMLDKDRRENSMGLAISLNVLLEFGREQSFDYTFEEFTAMAKEAGFTRTALIPLVPGARSTVPISSAAVAYKA